MVRGKNKGPVRGSRNTTFSVSCGVMDLSQIDARARSLGLDRSTYVIALCRQDCVEHREFVIRPIVEQVSPGNGGGA